jgi:hypothetical protein
MTQRNGNSRCSISFWGTQGPRGSIRPPFYRGMWRLQNHSHNAQLSWHLMRLPKGLWSGTLFIFFSEFIDFILVATKKKQENDCSLPKQSGHMTHELATCVSSLRLWGALMWTWLLKNRKILPENFLANVPRVNMESFNGRAQSCPSSGSALSSESVHSLCVAKDWLCWTLSQD